MEKKKIEDLIRRRTENYEMIINDQNQKLGILIKENEELKNKVAELQKKIEEVAKVNFQFNHISLSEFSTHKPDFPTEKTSLPTSNLTEPTDTTDHIPHLFSSKPVEITDPILPSNQQEIIDTTDPITPVFSFKPADTSEPITPNFCFQPTDPTDLVTPLLSFKPIDIIDRILPSNSSGSTDTIEPILPLFSLKAIDIIGPSTKRKDRKLKLDINRRNTQNFESELKTELVGGVPHCSLKTVLSRFVNCYTPAEQSRFFNRDIQCNPNVDDNCAWGRTQSFSGRKNAITPVKLSNYSEFMEKVTNANKAEKIQLLFELCNPKEKSSVGQTVSKKQSNPDKTFVFNPELIDHSQSSALIKNNIGHDSGLEALLKFQPTMDASNAKVPLDSTLLSPTVQIDSEVLRSFIDNFLIIGAEKSSIGIFNPEIDLVLKNLFIRKMVSNKETDHQIDQISKFVIPFGEKLKPVKVRNICGKVSSLISSVYLKSEMFSFSLNSEIGERINLFNYHQQEKDFKFGMLNATNSSGFAYFYCLKFEDFFVNLDNKMQFETDLYELFFYQKIMVIKTFYPFAKLFEELLMSAFVQIQTIKLTALNKVQVDGKVDFYAFETLDGNAQLEIESACLASTMNSLAQFSVTNKFGERLKIELLNAKQIEFVFPSLETAFYVESETHASLVFSLFSFEEFLFILFSIVLERSVIFVSEKLHDISCCISTFLTFLKPFQWQFPRIYSLPEDCLLMLQSPIPIISGLNLSVHNVLNDIIPEFESTEINSGSSNVYVFLDQGIFYYDFERFRNTALPNFNGLVDRFERFYRNDLNPKSSLWFKLTKQKKDKTFFYSVAQINLSKLKETITKLENLVIDFSNPKKLNILEKSQTNKKIDFVFRFFKQNFGNFIVSCLPKAKQSSEKLSNFQKEILNAFENAADFEFMEVFCRTQAFTYFMETDFYQS